MILLKTVYLIGGLILILKGAGMLTDGASGIARRLGVSDLVIGLTIVAFGTSAPELVISMMSAATGSTEIAVGNVVGSNIFNILVIIGLVAIIRPVKVGDSTLANELPMVFLSALALLAIGNGPMLDGSPRAEITRVSGILLLLFFAIFMRYTFHQARKPGNPGSADGGESTPVKTMPTWKAWVWVIVGLGMLIAGGDFFVDGASAIAMAMGVSEAIVGLTIVAVGTSLPELATSIVAARKGSSDMAVGNVVGSNIFNIFLVAGASATIRPLQFGQIGNVDLLTLTAACLLFWGMGRWGGRRIILRSEGIILVGLYVAYTIYLIINA